MLLTILSRHRSNSLASPASEALVLRIYGAAAGTDQRVGGVELVGKELERFKIIRGT